MIKKQLFLIALMAISLFSFAQSNNYLKGKITDKNKKPLAGVNLSFDNKTEGTTTNALGEFFFSELKTGSFQITISYTGYETQKISIEIKNGENILNKSLTETVYDLEGVVVTAQKRAQQIQDVPVSISAISNQTIQNLGINNLKQFSDLVPGFNARIQSIQRPTFVIRGLSSDEVSPSAQPRVSLFFNNTPISRASGGVLELYDMERIEVLKGPQGTLFGRGAQIGAVHFLTKMPESNFEGYVSMGFGNYSKHEFEAAFNTPIIKNKLNVRIAAAYNKQNGYVENTLGPDLNGKDTKGVRFSARYLASKNTKIDFVFNFQKDNAPGIAFVSGQFPNTNGVIDVFSYEASVGKNTDLKTNQEISNLLLNIRHYFNENVYLTAISSYQTNDSYGRWDGDGTAATAIDMAETLDANQFSQEVRLNFALSNNINGFAGFSYLREKVNQTYWFGPNEQHMVHLFLDPTYMIMPDGNPVTMPALPAIPELGPLGGARLFTDHEEESYNVSTNTTKEFFYDLSWAVTPKLKLNGGMRLVFDKLDVSNEAKHLKGSPSTLGFFTQNHPNVFFRPSPLQNTKGQFSGFTTRFNAIYKLNNSANIYASYARGRRPNIIQYQANATSEILSDEIVNSYEIGYKTFCTDNFLFDFIIFYHKYSNFQTNAWIADPNTGSFAYLIKDGGKATTYGLETSFQYSINKNFKLLGNYAYIKARFDDNDKYGNAQEYAENQFRLTPDHSFNLSIRYQTNLSSNIDFFAVPSMSYKSHYYFEDANTEGIDQDGYALFDVNAGIKFKKPNIILNIYTHNLFDKEYLLSAGNTGSLFGIPTYVAAAPRMFGCKLRYNF